MATHFIFALLSICLYCVISPTQSVNNGFSVELIHRDSLKSPFYNPSKTPFQRVVSAVHRSINNAKRFNKAYVGNVVLTDTVESTVIPDRGEYLMSYSVGTPPFKLYGIVDTGSDIVWLQCLPCETCYNQTTPIFDPSKSKTYRTIPCSSKCDSIRSASCSDGQTCEYTINYGDRSRSQGDLSAETLTLESTSGSPVSFPKTVIGCGHRNIVSFQGQSSGIVGLGGGSISLITQIGSSIDGKFSYCLVPMFSESNTSSKLSFADAAIVSGEGTVSTPIFQGDVDIFYYLTLEGISVGDKRVEFGSSSFESIQEGNIIIDSGTTLTLLPNDVYSSLESVLVDAIKQERVDNSSQQLSLCYQISSGQLEIPTIIAHFKGGDVKLNSLNTFIQVDDNVGCFAFAATESHAIFGNLAQQNMLVGYDLQNKAVSFKPTDCTKL